jgi:single-strand DNA-binding protein
VSVNKAILIGNLGAAPEMKYLPSGKAVCEMRIATSEKVKGEDKTEWHTVIAWEKTAENCAQYLEKGRSVYVEGRIQTRSWDDKKTGEKKYKTEIVAERVQFLGGKGEGGERSSSRPKPQPRTPDVGDLPPPGEDDIPF